jgi:hypothetical protein
VLAVAVSPILEKLNAVIREIDSSGRANPTRLTVLKKWFEQTGRLPAFGLWIAARAASRAGIPDGTAGELSEEARGILTGWLREEGSPPRADAVRLRARLRALQDTYQRQKWGSVRVIKDRNLLLVEEGLGLYLAEDISASRGSVLDPLLGLIPPGCGNEDRYSAALEKTIAPTFGHKLCRLVVDVEFDCESQVVRVPALNGLNA